MNVFWYRFLLWIAFPWVLYSAWKRCRKYKDADIPIRHCLASRFGRNPTPFQTGGIWIHAVSVGETRSIFPLLKILHQRYPELPLTVTSGSTQGAVQALKFAPVPIQHQMMPYDYLFAVKRFLNQIQPKLVLMVETEIWPNLYHECARQSIPLVLANARLKKSSFQAYQKWAPTLISDTLNKTRFIAAQFEADANNLRALEVDPTKIQVTGNIKSDIEIPPGLVNQAMTLRETSGWKDRFIWVGASTHEHEESLLLNAHRQLLKHFPNALLILVPRHANRFKDVENLVKTEYPNSAIRSRNEAPQASTPVYLADTVGELLQWFATADAAFIGGSLVPFGGHNILEPAALQTPVLSGKHYQNLQALFDVFLEENALLISHHENELAQQLIELAELPFYRQQMAEKAYACFLNQSGALSRLLKKLTPFIETKSGRF